MALNDDIALLSSVPLFQELGDDKLRLIAFGAERRRVPEGQTLFRQDTKADCGFIVCSGMLELTHRDQAGATHRVGTAEPGALVGEMAMITPVDRRLTAIAAEPTEVMRINRTLFMRMLEEYPDIASVMQRRISARLESLIGDLQALAPRIAGTGE